MDKTFYECYETGVISEITDYPVPLSLFLLKKSMKGFILKNFRDLRKIL